MFVPPALIADGLTAGVVLVISALLETSVFGSGVGCATNAGANADSKNIRPAIDFMASMLIKKRPKAEAIFKSRRRVTASSHRAAPAQSSRRSPDRNR